MNQPGFGVLTASARSLPARHPALALSATGAVVVLATLPTLSRPTLAIALVAVLGAAAIAWKSVVIPLALGGVPPLVDAIFGSDPLPKGGFTLLVSAWIAIALAFSVMRRDRPVALQAMMCLPFAATCVLLGLMVFRLGVSPDAAYGSTKVQLYIADLLIFFIAAVVVGTRAADSRHFFMVILGVASIGSLLFLVNLVGGGAHALVGGRFSLSAQEYPIELGRDSADGLLIAIYMLLAAGTAATRSWAIAATPALAVAMIAAGSRGPVVAFVFGLATLLALTATDARARRRLTLVAVVLLAATIVVPLVVPGSALGRSLSAIIGSASGLSSNGRSELWSTAIATFSHHTVLGIGTGGFAGLGTGLLYPHNILLEVATELGLFGAVALLAFLCSTSVRLTRLWRSTTGSERLLTALVLSLFVTALINACFSGAIQDNREVWLWGGIGIGMSARLASSRTASSSPRPRRTSG